VYIKIYTVSYPRRLISWGVSSPDLLELYYNELIYLCDLFKYI